MSIDQPQPAAAVPTERANGLATYFGVIFSPGEAFDTLSRVPMWGWACLLGMIVIVIAAIVGMPETMHAVQIMQQAQIAQASADQQQAVRDAYAKLAPAMSSFIVIQSLILAWIFWLIVSLVVIAGAAIGGGVASFRNAWTLTVNANLIALLGQLINNVILRFQGTDNLTKMSDLFALPSLAYWIHGDAKLTALLYSYNIVNLWYYIVLAIGARKLMKVGTIAACAIAIVVSVLIGLIARGLAR